jgi:hypothetical protein
VKHRERPPESLLRPTESTRVRSRTPTVTGRRAEDSRLRDHVEHLALAHPPIDPASVDYTMHRPDRLRTRYGPVLSYMARVELEVERNVLELETLLPDPPEIDRHFYANVWLPQEARHGLILSQVQSQLGLQPVSADLNTVSPKLQVLGALGHVEAFQDVSRMLYYLTGMATERSAVLAYNLLHDGLMNMGETAIAHTVIAPIRRQEPGHYAFYQMSARSLWGDLDGWQRWLVRRLRSRSFAPVGVHERSQRADFGDVVIRLGIDRDLDGFAAQTVRTEGNLLWAHEHGLRVPPYVARAFRESVEAAHLEPPIPINSPRSCPQPGGHGSVVLDSEAS